ncbi:MAG: biotin--[acetyl-CoA-carboxylase] ligase [Chloroflexota bacterium]|nr:biotin--[acetyl-CoA-carboxylase] ligase [Chloroflexota bacterium]
MDRLDPPRVQAILTTRVFGHDLVFLPCTGSTNDVAKCRAVQGAPEGMVVLTDEQTAGRGRMGRHWSAPPGTCLLCSILFRPTLPLAHANRLTMLCSLAAADAVEEAAGLRTALKWPNDLIVQSPTSNLRPPKWKKLAGILTETGIVGEQLAFVVVGIGINVNVGPKVLPTLAPDATSILAETGREVDRAALLAILLMEVESRYTRLQAGKSPHVEWAARLATLNQPVEATTSEGTLTGVAESVDEDGALLLRTPDGKLHRLIAGDVTLARV